MEIITGVERRRRWRAEEKLRIVAETEQPGASFAAVARRHEISRGLLWNWRQQVRRGDLAPEPMPVFVPVQITPDPPLACCRLRAPAQAASPAEDARVEITLPDGTCVRVERGCRSGEPAPDHGRGAPVIVPPTSVRVWLATGHTDMRRGMKGLALQVQQALQRDPHAGDLYVFRGRSGDRC